MKKLFPVYVRVPLIMATALIGLECLIDSGDKPAYMVYPAVPIFLGILLFALIALEIINSAFKNINYQLMNEEQRKAYDEKENEVFTLKDSKTYKKLMQRLTKSEPIENEKALMLDHNYDGIRELDNVLPPWWVYLFYICIGFGVIYLAKYHIFGGENQHQEYERKNTEALIAIEEWKKTAKDLVDAENVVALTEAADLNKGKQIFLDNCAACHLPDGGGSIGPNLTDDYWILGGGIKNIFHTISEGGREGKGMVPWKALLKPSEIQQVSSYILTLKGTTPSEPKAPEGDIWTEEAPTETDVQTASN